MPRARPVLRRDSDRFRGLFASSPMRGAEIGLQASYRSHGARRCSRLRKRCSKRPAVGDRGKSSPLLAARPARSRVDRCCTRRSGSSTTARCVPNEALCVVAAWALLAVLSVSSGPAARAPDTADVRRLDGRSTLRVPAVQPWGASRDAAHGWWTRPHGRAGDCGAPTSMTTCFWRPSFFPPGWAASCAHSLAEVVSRSDFWWPPRLHMRSAHSIRRHAWIADNLGAGCG